MAERYWEVGDLPDALMDWVSDQVAAAIKDCWEDDPPVCWAEDDDGKINLVFAGPYKPVENENEVIDVYSIRFDLVEMLKEYVEPYLSIGGPCRLEQLEDMRARAIVLRKLSADIAALADAADAQPLTRFETVQ